MARANGRGRGWRKKAWQDLAPSTQKRYSQYGIGPQEHATGLTPYQVQRWIEHQETVYGWSHEGGREYSVNVNGTEHVGELPRGAELARLIREQDRAEAAYQSGYPGRGHNVWVRRDPNVPEFMYFYHGLFN
jgi:hypothetical protein